MIAIGAEVTAVAIYFGTGFPTCRNGYGCSAFRCTDHNQYVASGRFGEFEYWFALIKVVAILAFIAVGAH